MMEKISKGFAVLCLSINFVSCAVYQNSDVGKVAGTIGGGLLGSSIGQGTGRLFAIGGGMVAGFMIGYTLGDFMDDTNQRRIYSALYYNQTNVSSCWIDRFGARYIVMPTSDLFAINGIPACREYCMTKSIKNKICEERGTACMRADSSWEVFLDSPELGVGIFQNSLK